MRKGLFTTEEDIVEEISNLFYAAEYDGDEEEMERLERVLDAMETQRQEDDEFDNSLANI